MNQNSEGSRTLASVSLQTPAGDCANHSGQPLQSKSGWPARLAENKSFWSDSLSLGPLIEKTGPQHPEITHRFMLLSVEIYDSKSFWVCCLIPGPHLTWPFSNISHSWPASILWKIFFTWLLEYYSLWFYLTSFFFFSVFSFLSIPLHPPSL